MSDKILFVDDEVGILHAMKRQLRKRYEIATAESGKEALEILKDEGPFSVVISDMRMPVMDGIELLTTIKKLYPDTVRMMLTGNADQETAIEAVNKGHIFKFLIKPCPVPTLVTSIALAQRQYRLITAERELLNETLKGSVKVLSELLSFVSPTAFSSGLRIRSLVVQVARAMGIEAIWRMELASLMSQIGCVTLPTEIIDKVYGGAELDEEELEMYQGHPEAGALLLEKIPRMQEVSSIIRHQLKDYSEYIDEDLVGEAELGAQIIHAVSDYDLLRCQGMEHKDALRRLHKRKGAYNPEILKHFTDIQFSEETPEILSLKIRQLQVGMIAEEDITAKNDTLLAPKGQEITGPVLQGLQNFAKKVGVKEPVRIFINRK